MNSVFADKPEVKMRLHYLDGLRGLAAAYVMLSHAYALAIYDDNRVSRELPTAFVRLTAGLDLAHYAVAVFIVLSGFCLMLPVVRAKDKKFSGGLLGFAERRARRILPPYYACLILVIGILFASDHFVKHTASAADLSFGEISSHLLLIHNLFSKYNSGLDGPMWSVAWEWQIYFLFALVLLPIWRRFGIGWSVTTGVVLGFLPGLFLPSGHDFSWTSPWYLGLFAFGMAAASTLSSPKNKIPVLKHPIFIRAVCGAIAAGFVGLTWFHPQWLHGSYIPLFDILMGVFTALLILGCADRSRPDRIHTAVCGVLESRPAMVVGTFSYSLYLIHYPILQKMHSVLNQRHTSHFIQIVLLEIVGTPICLGLAYLFHLAFERPFMSKPGQAAPKTERQAEVAAIVNPAP